MEAADGEQVSDLPKVKIGNEHRHTSLGKGVLVKIGDPQLEVELDSNGDHVAWWLEDIASVVRPSYVDPALLPGSRLVRLDRVRPTPGERPIPTPEPEPVFVTIEVVGGGPDQEIQIPRNVPGRREAELKPYKPVDKWMASGQWHKWYSVDRRDAGSFSVNVEGARTKLSDR
jgi:hypothetical protein